MGDEWGADFVPSMREALRCWNMTVQHWLVLVVYKRFPVKALRTTMVMIVSSVWHGVHPGYYLGLGSVPLCLAVEDLWRVKIRSRLSEDAQYWLGPLPLRQNRQWHKSARGEEGERDGRTTSRRRNPAWKRFILL